MASQTQTYTVVLQPVQDEWYGYCLEIPDCVGKGPGKQVAYKAVKEAIRKYLYQKLLDRKPIPRRKIIIKHPRFDLSEFGVEPEDPR